ncbi:MAG: diguanylate cyclase [Phycisphaerae bacterium]
MFVQSERRRIILADDDRDALKLLSKQLERAGYSVVGCENGREALEAIQREGACLVIADWEMPEMDGIEVCRAVREISALNGLSFVYFVLLTARAGKEQVVAGLEAGADDYLTKPYHFQELLARLRAGERILELQQQLWKRQLELHKNNLEMATLNQKLHDLAHTDTLTRLPNRRSLFDRINQAWDKQWSPVSPLSLLMLDVDRFKGVNDKYGHAGGDAVLREVADVVRTSIRGCDGPGRFGGEEFCVVFPHCPLAQAGEIAEQLRANVEARVIKFEDKIIPVTISIGVGSRHARHSVVDDLIADADAMLYKAKENGRNQVWLTDSDGGEWPLELKRETTVSRAG